MNSPEKARKTPRRPFETAAIVGGRLVNRLTAHIMADAFTEPEPVPEGQKPKKSPLMTESQVHACLGLLKKYMPDLKSIEHSGNPDRPVIQRIERHIVDPAHTADSAGISPATEPE